MTALFHRFRSCLRISLALRHRNHIRMNTRQSSKGIRIKSTGGEGEGGDGVKTEDRGAELFGETLEGAIRERNSCDIASKS